MMYIGDWMARGALFFPERLAVVDADAPGSERRLTYLQLNERANRLAQVLRAQGVGRSDRVGLLSHNGVEYLDAFFACGKLGATFVPCRQVAQSVLTRSVHHNPPGSVAG